MATSTRAIFHRGAAALVLAFVVALGACGKSSPATSAGSDGATNPADAAGGETAPVPIICHGGCLCARTAANCPVGCFSAFAQADGGALEFVVCANGSPLLGNGPADGGLTCTYDRGGTPGGPNSFGTGCPSAGCPAGTVCVWEGGGGAGGGGNYCAAIPVECSGTPTCACMGACACRSGVGLRPELCTDQGGMIFCDNGIR